MVLDRDPGGSLMQGYRASQPDLDRAGGRAQGVTRSLSSTWLPLCGKVRSRLHRNPSWSLGRARQALGGDRNRKEKPAERRCAPAGVSGSATRRQYTGIEPARSASQHPSPVLKRGDPN